MYTEFYHLREKPFEITPDPKFLYLSENHREALAHLVYAVRERKGFTVITGEVGTGKTTLIQTLLSRLDGKTRTAYLFNPRLEPNDFLNTICEDLGLRGLKRYKGQYLQILHSFLLNCYSTNENVILIIDEAQNLDAQLLEEVRLLTNLETPKNKLLQVILTGQPELDDALNRPECRQLKQRISLRYRMQPLTQQEMKEYIQYRLRKAGGLDTDLFTSKAIQRICDYSNGIPRLINIVCDNAMLTGYATNRKVIGAEIIDDVIGNLEGPSFRIKKKRLRTMRLMLWGTVGLAAMVVLVWYGSTFNPGETLQWAVEFREAVVKGFQGIWNELLKWIP